MIMKALSKKQVTELTRVTKNIVRDSLRFGKMTDEEGFMIYSMRTVVIKRLLLKFAVDLILLKDTILNDYPQWRDES